MARISVQTAQAIGVDEFIQNFDGGAKPNLYRVEIPQIPLMTSIPNELQGPADGESGKNSFQFFARSTVLPASTLGEMIAPYMGRQIKVPGDRTFEDWTTTILADEAQQVRGMLEVWNSNILNSYESNRPNADDTYSGNLEGWKGFTGIFSQLDRTGNPTRQYTMTHMFPKEVGSVDVAYDNNDTIQEFTVTWAYSYFTVKDFVV